MSLTEKAGKFVLAVGLVSVVASLSFFLVGMIGAGEELSTLSFGDFGKLWLGYIPVMIPFISVAGLVAMPISALLVKVGLANWLAFALVGAIVGAVFTTLLFASFALSSNIPVWASVGVLPGVTAGLFWWQTVVRPERAERGLAA